MPADIALPSFDEYLLFYKERSAVLAAAHAQKVCSGGDGVFALCSARLG